MRWGFWGSDDGRGDACGISGALGGLGLKSRLQSSGLREQVQNLIPFYGHISRVIISNPPKT